MDKILLRSTIDKYQSIKARLVHIKAAEEKAALELTRLEDLVTDTTNDMYEAMDECKSLLRGYTFVVTDDLVQYFWERNSGDLIGLSAYVSRVGESYGELSCDTYCKKGYRNYSGRIPLSVMLKILEKETTNGE